MADGPERETQRARSELDVEADMATLARAVTLTSQRVPVAHAVIAWDNGTVTTEAGYGVAAVADAGGGTLTLAVEGARPLLGAHAGGADTQPLVFWCTLPDPAARDLEIRGWDLGGAAAIDFSTSAGRLVVAAYEVG